MSARRLQKRLPESSAAQEPKILYLAGELHRKFPAKITDESGRTFHTKVKLPTGCVGVMFAFGDSFRAKCYSPENKPIAIQVNGK